jgi:heterodisulfide reductase subunit A-like polyferredoxin
MKKLIVLITLIWFNQMAFSQDIKNYDTMIYGGTSAGISAAIQASRMGKAVVVIEPAIRIDGLTTGGLGQTDTGNKQAIGGISCEFYQNVKNITSNPKTGSGKKAENDQ